jgi:hypothetical protein
VGDEVGSKLPSMQKHRAGQQRRVGAKGAVHQICAGYFDGQRGLDRAARFDSALSTHLAPCEWPMAPSALALSLLKKGLESQHAVLTATLHVPPICSIVPVG